MLFAYMWFPFIAYNHFLAMCFMAERRPRTHLRLVADNPQVQRTPKRGRLSLVKG